MQTKTKILNRYIHTFFKTNKQKSEEILKLIECQIPKLLLYCIYPARGKQTIANAISELY